MTTFEGRELPSMDAVQGLMNRFAEDRAVAAKVREHRWSLLTNRQKADKLISGVDPDHVMERDMPKIALAQVHATLALKD